MSDSEQVSQLGKIIWDTSRADEGTISFMGANIVARAILSSDWMKRHDTEVRAGAFTADEVVQIANETSDSWGNLYRLDFIDRIRHEAAPVEGSES